MNKAVVLVLAALSFPLSVAAQEIVPQGQSTTVTPATPQGQVETQTPAAAAAAAINAVPAQMTPEESIPPAPEQEQQPMEEKQIAVLRTIDKLSARTHTFDVAVDKTVKFGRSLYIKVRACRKSSPLDQPESAGFLQVWEKATEKDESKWVFSGWMFASNPSLSAMDHPVYDVWLIDCKNAETSEKPVSDPAPVPDKPAAPAKSDADDDAGLLDETPPPSASVD